MRHLLILLCAALGGCGSAPAPRAAPAVRTPKRLVWTPSGDRLVVDHHTIVHVEDGRTERIRGAGRPIFAADGHIVWLASGALEEDGRRTALPALQHPPVPDLELQGLWLDLQRLYLHEWHPIKRTAACRIYDRRTAGLRTPAACLAVPHPTRLQAGPGDLLAVFEQQQAGPSLTLARYTPSAGTTVLRRFDLRPDGAVALAFSADGGLVRLASACDLSKPRPCAGPARLGQPWLFEFDLLADGLHRTQPLPAGAVPSATGRIAWPTPGGVCMAAHPGAQPRCRSLVSTPEASGYSTPHVGDDHP